MRRDSAIALLGPALLLLLPSAAASAAAGPKDHCASLDTGARSRADALMTKLFPHDCCDRTLAECAAADNPSRLVKRLAAEVCRRVADGEEDAVIIRQMKRRGASMAAVGPPPKIDLSGVSWAGAPDAPVQVVAYVCARCPFCARLTPQLYRAVTKGELAGKARLALRLFPIRSHENSVELAMGVEAAGALGKFWPFVLQIYEHFAAAAPDKLSGWAEELGLDVAEFERLSKAPATRKQLAASKQEGLKNKVQATPTVYIDGKAYRADLSIEALSDTIAEEYDRARGTLCKP